MASRLLLTCHIFSLLPKTKDAINFMLIVTWIQSGQEELSPSKGKRRTNNDRTPINIVNHPGDD